MWAGTKDAFGRAAKTLTVDVYPSYLAVLAELKPLLVEEALGSLAR